MGYQSRKRNYKSRRERYERDKRIFKIIAGFAILALLILAFLKRHDWIGYLKTFFY